MAVASIWCRALEAALPSRGSFLFSSIEPLWLQQRTKIAIVLEWPVGQWQRSDLPMKATLRSLTIAEPSRVGGSITLRVPGETTIRQLLNRLPKKHQCFEDVCRLRGDVYAEWIAPELTIEEAFAQGLLTVGVAAHAGFKQPFTVLDGLLPEGALDELAELADLSNIAPFDIVDFNNVSVVGVNESWLPISTAQQWCHRMRHITRVTHRPSIVAQANGGKHANAIELQDCIGWPDHYDFEESRLHRGNPYYWKNNANSIRLARLQHFVEQLDFFEVTAKVTIIHNAPGVPGIEHIDHKIADLVSEFVWFRCDSKKQFFVRDSLQGYPWLVQNQMIFFHDRLSHNIDTIDVPCFSVRVDGKFSPWFRDYLARVGYFYDADLRKVMAGQSRWASTPTHWPDKEISNHDMSKEKGKEKLVSPNRRPDTKIQMDPNEALHYYSYMCAIK